MSNILTTCQQLALISVAKNNNTESIEKHDKAIDYLKNVVRVAIQMNASILPSLIKDKHYKNMFETKTSSGSNSSAKRLEWEHKLFSCVYDGVDPVERVKYGFLYGINDVRMKYGDCLLILKDTVKNRCTVTIGDSSNDLKPYLLSEPSSILQDAFCSFDAKTCDIIGKRNKTIYGYKFNTGYDDYVEVQIHGKIILATDVEKIIISAKYCRDKTVIQHAEQFAKINKCSYEFKEF